MYSVDFGTKHTSFNVSKTPAKSQKKLTEKQSDNIATCGIVCCFAWIIIISFLVYLALIGVFDSQSNGPPVKFESTFAAALGKVANGAALTSVSGANLVLDRVCNGTDCDTLPEQICTDTGFLVELTGFEPASGNNDGVASYTYTICTPNEGTCTLANGTVFDPPLSCLGHSKCRLGPLPDDALCDRLCATDKFHELSHFDVALPSGACVNADTTIVSVECSNGVPTIGDGSCDTGSVVVAKCDETTIANAGECFTMTIGIPGEGNGPGIGLSYVVDKASTQCTGTCLAGPSCEPCDAPPPEEGRCLTRTIGFWGTHPWITNNYSPVDPCGHVVGCFGPNQGGSDPSCPVGTCNSVMEALGSIAPESKKDRHYISFLAQLTAALLNGEATQALFPGQSDPCPGYQVPEGGPHAGKSLDELVAACSALACGGNGTPGQINACTDALDAFNNSPDQLGPGGETPSPFDRPGIDDDGNTQGADAIGFVGAHHSGVVIGRKTKTLNCQ